MGLFRFRPRVNFTKLRDALEEVGYHIGYCTFGGGVFVYADQDMGLDKRLAYIEVRDGAFSLLVNKIEVFDKELDEFFQRMIGLDYFRLRRWC